MLEHYEIQTIEQLRTVADVLRIQIIDLLIDKPMTVTQLGDLLGLAPAKIHYHVRELEKVGLLQLVETREKGGILEKYYQPVARDFSLSNDLIHSASSDDSLAATGAFIDEVKLGFQRAFRSSLERKDEQTFLFLGSGRLYVTAEEGAKLAKKIVDLFKPYENPRNIEGEYLTTYTLIGYPLPAFQQEMPDSASANEEDMPTKSAWTVGSVSFNRRDLEKIVAEGRRLRLNVTGICTFANDVSPELADKAVEQLHLVGKLQASSAVRDVLLGKRS
jgi:DNA-binding transcriptional ArsR family regulator